MTSTPCGVGLKLRRSVRTYARPNLDNHDCQTPRPSSEPATLNERDLLSCSFLPTNETRVTARRSRQTPTRPFSQVPLAEFCIQARHRITPRQCWLLFQGQDIKSDVSQAIFQKVSRQKYSLLDEPPTAVPNARRSETVSGATHGTVPPAFTIKSTRS